MKRPGELAERREFIKAAGFAILAVQCLPVTACASGTSVGAVNQLPDDLVITSGPGAFHHTHYLRIPKAILAEPPVRGVELTTTKALLHEHRIVMTKEELRGVNQGETVIQRASSHVFVIALASERATREPVILSAAKEQRDRDD